MSPETESGAYSLVLDGVGVVNGTRFTAKGRGEGNSESGGLFFEVEFSDVHEGTDLFANMLAVLITPRACSAARSETRKAC